MADVPKPKSRTPKEIRQIAGWSQERTAVESRVSSSLVRNYERDPNAVADPHKRGALDRTYAKLDDVVRRFEFRTPLPPQPVRFGAQMRTPRAITPEALRNGSPMASVTHLYRLVQREDGSAYLEEVKDQATTIAYAEPTASAVGCETPAEWRALLRRYDIPFIKNGRLHHARAVDVEAALAKGTPARRRPRPAATDNITSLLDRVSRRGGAR